MSAEGAEKKKPGKVSRFFSKIFSAPKRLSVAARASCLLSLFLIILTIVVFVVFLNDPINVPWKHSLGVWRILSILGLLVVIPIVFYQGLSLWLEGEKSRFPDLDFAFRAGIETLKHNGLTLDSAPVYLILGSSGERLEKALMQSSGIDPRVSGVPEGPAPLHWYANPHGIYLLCTEAGALSALARLVEKRTAESHAAGHSRRKTDMSPATSTFPPSATSVVQQPAASQPQPQTSPTATPKPAGLFVADHQPAPAAAASPATPPPTAPPAAAQAPAAPKPPTGSLAGSPRGTMELDQFVSGENPPPAAKQADPVRGTMSLDQFVSGQQPPSAAQPSPQPGAPPSGSILGGIKPNPPARPAPDSGTAMSSAPLQAPPVQEPPIQAAASPDQAPSTPAPAASAPVAQPHPTRLSTALAAPEVQASTVMPSRMDRRAALLSPQDSAEQLRRLRHVARLLKSARQPLCGINGIMTLPPFESFQANLQEVEQLEKAVKSDLSVIQSTLQLRCPVTALVVGLEKERGFSELVQRVGPNRAASQRFGRRFDMRCPATSQELSSLSAHVCGAFEDWVYTLFREEGSLTRPGNTRLFALLCKIRSRLKGRLASILANGYGYDAEHQLQDEPFAFSGCYFAATGDTEDRQAFVKAIFDKLEDEQEDVEWTRNAWILERRYRQLAYVGMIVSAGLLLSLGFMYFS